MTICHGLSRGPGVRDIARLGACIPPPREGSNLGIILPGVLEIEYKVYGFMTIPVENVLKWMSGVTVGWGTASRWQSSGLSETILSWLSGAAC